MSEQPLAERAESLIKLVGGLQVSVEASNLAITQSNNQIAESNKRIGELGLSNKRNRHLIAALAVSLMFDLVLSIVLGITAVNASTASHKAAKASAAASQVSTQNAANAVALCHATNDSRASAKALWTHVIALIPVHGSESQKTLIDLQNFVNKLYTPRKC